MEYLSIIISGILALLQLGTMAVGVAWTVAKINATTLVLNNSIVNLSVVVAELKGVVTVLSAEVGKQGNRITKLETMSHKNINLDDE